MGAFHGRTGKAYLFTNACNFTHGHLEERNMIIGVHQVMDVYCKGCDWILGWKYEKAFDKDQAYKVGSKSVNFVWRKPGSRKKFWLCCQIRHQDLWASFLIIPSTVPPAPTFPLRPPLQAINLVNEVLD